MRCNLLILILVVSWTWFGRAEELIPECILNYKSGTEQYILIAEKETQSLFVCSNYHPKPLLKVKITTGKIPGRKELEGDLKTPEGIYFFTKILSGEELPKVDDYGDKAFTLNYPNAVDIREGRNGSGIWLHGAFDPEKTNDPNNSRGCVVMSNKDLIKISKYIFLNQTPLCIYTKVPYKTEAEIKHRRENLIHHIKKWKTSWETKQIEKYIHFYSHDFKYSGMALPQFKAYKKRLNQRYEFIRVFLSKVDVYAFKNYYVTMFNQLYISDQNHFYNKKIQYWENNQKNPKIMAEQSIPLPLISKFEITQGNYVGIDEFRKKYLARLRSTTYQFKPSGLILNNISVHQDSVHLYLNQSGSTEPLRVIPVILLKNNDLTHYKSLENIVLNNGVPQDYSQSIEFPDKKTPVVIRKDAKYTVRSLTLFAVGRDNQLRQIITYFINR